MGTIIETEFVTYWRALNFELRARRAFVTRCPVEAPFATAIACFGKLDPYQAARYIAFPDLDQHEKRLTREGD